MTAIEIMDGSPAVGGYKMDVSRSGEDAFSVFAQLSFWSDIAIEGHWFDA